MESGERLLQLQSQVCCLQRLQSDNLRELAAKDVHITKLQAGLELLQQEGACTHTQVGITHIFWCSV